jgi:hypothetical protein
MAQPIRRILLRLPLFMALMVAGWLYLHDRDARAGERLESFSLRSSTETRIIKIVDGDKAILIPRNYLTGLWANPDGSPFIVGMASMPNFSGAESGNIDCFFFGRNRECSLVQFSYRGSLNWSSDQYRRRFELLVGSDSNREDFAYGLQRTLLPNAYVFVGPTDQETIFIFCNEHSKICNMSVDLDGGRWHVQMNVTFLDQWGDILKKFMDFMSPRIVDAR